MAKRLLALLPLTALVCVPFLQSADPPRPATMAPDFTLTDPRDKKSFSLADCKDRKAVVVAFLGTGCPISNAYLGRLAELHAEYSPKGVQFIAINSNAQDSADEVAAHAKKYELPFPVLKDENNVVADKFGAARLSEVFVIAGGTVRYDGRIDDQFGIGYQRPKPTKRYLADALDAVLAGKEVAVTETAAEGCKIGRVPPKKDDGTVTYNKHVARILQEHCQECHRPGQIGPMPLLSYGDARALSETIKEVVEQRRMPPWLADPKVGKFSNDRSLPKEDRDQLLAWIEQGCPRGDPKDAPEPRKFTDGWSIAKPDLVISMGEDFEVPAAAPKGGIEYQYFTVDPHLTEDKWVVEAEARAGAPEVVHHILVYVEPPGKKFVPNAPGNVVLCGVAPGDTALHMLPHTAKKLEAGSKLIFQMHYTPNGKAVKDRSTVGIVFSKEKPDWVAITVPVVNPTFKIPAGADNHKVESDWKFKRDGVILGFMPHMHLRGKDFFVEVIHPDGTKESLLSVPRYDFGWQNTYRLEKPYPVKKGAVIHCVAHFDNSEKNPNNPDPKVDVRWGDQTWEEMMIGWTEVAFPPN
jgi:peroxiredoxin